jgi:hydroxyethylthiazole kinase-like uncharacterized protein yjeF
MNPLGCPILSHEDSAAWEARLFEGDEAKEWEAMQRAGRAVADAIVRDFGEIGGFPPAGKIFVLAGKGHNAGDAFIAAENLLARFPRANAEVLLVFGPRSFRPLARRAFQSLIHAAKARVAIVPAPRPGQSYDLSLDGIFGFQFRPPATPVVLKLAERINALPIRFRAAVDLPSGGVVRADFTYATGIVKSTLLTDANAGRPRFLDLGFFADDAAGNERVLTARMLAPLAGWRAPASDKRSYGHVFLLGGSRQFPGAILMSVLAALRSGVGLVTAFVPESLVAAFAARAPEAMWVGWPETPEGSLALEGQPLLKERLERATALVIGPGLGRDAETRALVADVVKTSSVPVLLDADALQRDVVAAAKTPLVLTPHAGEFARIAGDATPRDFAGRSRAVVVLKGPITRIAAVDGAVHHSFFGGPVLARGGSGDLLAGLMGGLLAQTPDDPLLAACRGVVWHGLAADALARAHGLAAVQVTQLLDFLATALRESADGP